MSKNSEQLYHLNSPYHIYFRPISIPPTNRTRTHQPPPHLAADLAVHPVCGIGICAWQGYNARAAGSVLKIVPLLALSISLSVLIGVIMAIIAKFTIWKQYKKEQNLPEHPLGVRTWITMCALIPDVLIPIAFVAAWSRIFFVFP